MADFPPITAGNLLHFNGKLFKQPETLPLDYRQIEMLIDAAKADWKHVEPAIFGTLLERALSPSERHKLGAHYTPRVFVERLVLPTVIEPLRVEWSEAQAAALTLAAEGKVSDAIEQLYRFHQRLCSVRVLDPACGSGNFLYVTLEHLKRLEGEVLNALDALGERQTGLALEGERFNSTSAETVDPHNLLGIELNPLAAEIAEIVLWIGYLQWHFKTRGSTNPPQPVIRDFRNIENRDAVLAYDSIEEVTDSGGQVVTRWDGHSKKLSNVTGEEIPDETARVAATRYIGARQAEWPAADFIVGNPPYIGVRTLRSTIGDAYVDQMRETYSDVPETCDYVMYWWDRAAKLVAAGRTRRFGLITTNSIKQEYSRKLLKAHMGDGGGIKLVFAIPDHPWVDASDGASVGVAMTVGCSIVEPHQSVKLGAAQPGENGSIEIAIVDRIGISLTSEPLHEAIRPLKANAGMCFQGVVPAGDGFKLTLEDLASLGLDESELPSVVRRYMIGKDIVQKAKPKWIIDFFGFSEEQARTDYPGLYQRLFDRVYPERRQNPRASYRDKWWLFAEPRPALRDAISGLRRYIGTPYTAKHRPFVFVQGEVVPDAMVYVIASSDAAVLAVLSSTIHHRWALSAGGTLEDRPRYNSKGTFFPFPFPATSDERTKGLRRLGEEMNAFRERQLAVHSGLSLTDVYNVLAKLREGEALDARDRVVHEQGLVSVLRRFHDEIDQAVLDAYGWSDLASLLRQANRVGDSSESLPQADVAAASKELTAELVGRVVALNSERISEETRGNVRWLRATSRVDQSETNEEQSELHLQEVSNDEPPLNVTATVKEWPKDVIGQVRAVSEILLKTRSPLTADDVAKQFKARGAWKKRVPQLLEMLVAVGSARTEEDGRYFGLRAGDR